MMKSFVSLLLASLLLAVSSLFCLAEPYPEETVTEGAESLLNAAEPYPEETAGEGAESLLDASVQNTEKAEAETPSAFFDDSFYRFNDYAGVVTPEEEKELNEKATAAAALLRTDFPILVAELLEDDERDVTAYAEDYYGFGGFGFGEARDGIMLAVDLTSSVFDVLVFGNLYELVTDKQVSDLRNIFLEACHDEGKRFYDAFDVYLDAAISLAESVRSRYIPDGGIARGSDPGKPYWYPDDIASFVNYTEEKPMRVVDDAEIFTPEEEAILEEKAKRISDTYGFGFAMFTDRSTYGLSMEVYSADFLYFNGYGMGDDFSSAVFFLSLEEGNRGWRTTSTNRCERIFTSDVTYEIDELVDADMRAGNYFTAFNNQIDYVEGLLADICHLPGWYPEGTDILNLDRTDRDFSGASGAPSSHFADNAGMFSQAYEAKCEEKLGYLCDTYGADIVLFTDASTHSVGLTDYASDFYCYNGYGEVGLCLLLVPDSGDCARAIYKSDAFRSQYGSVSLGYTLDDLSSDDPEKAVDRFLRDTEFLLKHGRLPMSMGMRAFCLAAGLVLGFIIAKDSVSRMKKGMTLNCELYATEYLAGDSLVITRNEETFLRTDVSKKARPRDTGSSRSGGGGGSSYSHGSSSGGGSYSSGGRNF